RLANVVGQRLGYGVLDPLRERPGDAQAAAAAKNAIDSATYADPSFASEIQALVAELDRRGARQLVNQVYAETNVQSFGSGIAAGRDVYIQEGRDPDDLSWTPAWVKACIGLGGAVALAGMLIFFYTLFTDNPDVNDPSFGQMPSGIPIAFGVFFAGLIISAIG